MSQNHETLDSDNAIVIAGYTGLFRSTTFTRRESYPSRRRDVQTLSCYDQANANGNAVMSRNAVSFKANYLEMLWKSIIFGWFQNHREVLFFLFCELAIENALKPFKRWHNIDFPYSFVEADFENIYFSSSCWQIHTLDVAENVVNLIVN